MEGHRGRRASPQCWTRTSFFAFAGLSAFLLSCGAWFLAAQLSPSATVVVRSCGTGAAARTSRVAGSSCTVAFRHDGVADLVDVDTDASYPRGRALVVHVTSGGTLVQDAQAQGGLAFIPLGLLPLVLVVRWGWPPSAARRGARPDHRPKHAPVSVPVPVAPALRAGDLAQHQGA